MKVPPYSFVRYYYDIKLPNGYTGFGYSLPDTIKNDEEALAWVQKYIVENPIIIIHNVRKFETHVSQIFPEHVED